MVGGRAETHRLATELGLDPRHPPARLILDGYASLGQEVLARVDGAFALLIWDEVAQQGLLARDRLGTLPLFVAWQGDSLLFSTEVRHLLQMLDRRPEPDTSVVSAWLAGTRTRGDRTLYRGVTRLLAAHALRLDPGRREPFRYWMPTYAAPEALGADEAAELLGSGLEDAVTRSLTGVKQAGLMLSGGLDSAAVSAAAVRQHPLERLCAYSTVFPGRDEVDESGRITQVRDWLGLPGVRAAFLDGSVLGGELEFLEAWELPSASPNRFIWQPMLKRAACDGAEVMLSGEGGDELFGCAVYLLADRLRRGHAGQALALARRLPGMGDQPRPRWLLRAMAKYGIRGALPHAPHQLLRRLRGRAVPAWMSDRSAALHQRSDDPWRWKRLDGPRWWSQMVDLLTDRGDAIGAADQHRREAALSGLTMGQPLRDLQLIELVLGLGPELAFDARLDRPLARRALRSRLPADFLASDAKPFFNSVLTGSLAGRDLEPLRAILSDPHPALAWHVRPPELARMLRSKTEAKPSMTWGTEVWRLAAIELWLDHQYRPERVAHVKEALDPRPTVSFSVNRTGCR